MASSPRAYNRYLRDYQHSSWLFRSADWNVLQGETSEKHRAFDLAPHYKFLFHVYFEFASPEGIPSQHIETPGLLVKTVKLPAYKIKTEELNQYNRTRHIQTKLNYEPINITFHADNSGMVLAMWKQYYKFHYSDSDKEVNNVTFGKHNVYANDTEFTAGGYWGMRSQQNLFFKSIRIFGMSRGDKIEYRIMNPLIMSWEHDTYDYSEITGTMTHSMTVAYESVIYGEGKASDIDSFQTPGSYDPEALTSSVGTGGLTPSDLGQIGPTGDTTKVPNQNQNQNPTTQLRPSNPYTHGPNPDKPSESRSPTSPYQFPI